MNKVIPALIFLSAFLLTLHLVDNAYADYLGEKDWTGNKRILCYSFSPDGDFFPPDFKKFPVGFVFKMWFKEAADNWNKVKDETGWEFKECPSDQTPDLFVLQNDIKGKRYN